MAESRDRHEDHDPLLVAGLIDADLPAAERAVAEALVAGCSACADLHADLVALSSATRVLPAPARRRDFRLSAADAARLTAEAAEEPGAEAARLTGVMTDTRDHAAHDTLLVAALADRALDGQERVDAQRLVDTCSLCASLHADLVSISAATRDLPTPARPRDFMLTPADAARLRPSGWRRLVAAFGTSRDGFSRPLAASLTALGLAGLLFASLPGAMGGPTSLSTTGNAIGAPPAAAAAGQGAKAAPSAAGSAPAAIAAPVASPAALPDRGAVTAGGQPLPTGVDLAPAPAQPAASSEAYGPVVQPSPEAVYSGSGENGAGAGATGDDGGQANDQSTNLESSAGTRFTTAAGGPSTLVVLSGLLLLVGLGLFAIRWTVRRLGRD